VITIYTPPPRPAPPTTRDLLQAEIDRIMDVHAGPLRGARYRSVDQETVNRMVIDLERACVRLGLDRRYFHVDVESTMRLGASVEVRHSYGDAHGRQALPWPEMTWERFRELYGDGLDVGQYLDWRREMESDDA
jgi:hypothetical protein